MTGIRGWAKFATKICLKFLNLEIQFYFSIVEVTGHQSTNPNVEKVVCLKNT